MTFILRYTHKDQRSQAYSFPIKFGSYWDAKHKLRWWRFDLYAGKVNRSNVPITKGQTHE